MEKYNSIEKGWRASLESANTELILQSIYEIRNSGSVRILPTLFGLINKNTDIKVTNEIIKLRLKRLL